MNSKDSTPYDTAHPMFRLGVRTLWRVAAAVVGCVVALLVALDPVMSLAEANKSVPFVLAMIAISLQLPLACIFFMRLRTATKGYRSRALGTDVLCLQLLIAALSTICNIAFFLFSMSLGGPLLSELLWMVVLVLSLSPGLIVWRAAEKLEQMFLTDRKIATEA